MESFESTEIQSSLFDCVPLNASSDGILVSDLNLAGALPYSYHHGTDEEVEITVQSFVKKNGEFLETRIKGKQVGSVQNDILMLWQTMFWEQHSSADDLTQDGKILIHYNISQMTERMGYKDGSRRIVSDAIADILNLKYEIQNFGYVEYKDGQKHLGFKKQRMNLVTRHGEVKGISDINGKVSNKAMFFVELDATILKNISAGMVARIDTSQYLKLKSGPQRRLLPQLEAKRKLLGPKFTIRLTEVASVLGFNNPSKQHERVSSTFKKLKKTLGNIDYKIFKRPGIHEWDIHVEFKENLLEKPVRSEVESFYDLLLVDYGKEKLSLVDLKVRDIEIIKGQIENNLGEKDVEYDFHGEKCLLYQFLIDLALFQIIKESYALTSKLSTFVLSLLGALKSSRLGIPAGYRHFLEYRIQKEEEERVLLEVELARKREEEEIRIAKEIKSETFDKNFENLIFKNSEIKKSLYEKALKKWLKAGNTMEDLDCPIMGKANTAFVERTMKEIAKEEFLMGRLMDNLGVN